MADRLLSLKPGDRVQIVSPHHPWHGYEGVIARPWESAREIVPTGFDWVVSLRTDDALNGHECAAASLYLRRLPDA